MNKLALLIVLIVIVIGCSSNKTGYVCGTCEKEVARTAPSCPHCNQVFDASGVTPVKSETPRDQFAEPPTITDLLDGQEATEARTVQTETGGTPHHEPIQYRAKDSRDAIVTPEFIAGSEAQIAGGTKGIGITINGESRFYPLYVMQYHQVINDTLQDTAIAASY